MGFAAIQKEPADETTDLLHELAESLQAAASYLEVVRSAEVQHADPLRLQKVAQQLERASLAFGRLRAAIKDGRPPQLERSAL
jgi:hypothetical protein